MDDKVFIMFMGGALGLVFGAILITAIFAIGGAFHFDHIRDYNACLKLDAPQQKCFEAYLVPPRVQQ